MTDSAVMIPTISKGAVPSLTRIVPFTRANSYVGVKGDSTSYKYMKLQDKPVTAKEYAKALKKYQAAKEKSNAKAAEELADHVEK